MAQSLFKLRAGVWAGWQELPGGCHGDPVWDCSPIFIETVRPMKTGRGLLQVGFVQTLYPRAPKRRAVEVSVVTRDESYLVGAFREGGSSRTTIMTELAPRWIELRCRDLWTRFSVDKPASWSEPYLTQSFEGEAAYLEALFGRDASDILTPVTKNSFGCDKPAMPSSHCEIFLGTGYSAFDSYLIARGFRPRQMEDKWFVYLEDDRLRMRRSWTGHLIYDIDAKWRGDQLYLGAAQLNRDPQQYGGADEAFDRAEIEYLINSLLLRLPSRMPLNDTSNAAVGSGA